MAVRLSAAEAVTRGITRRLAPGEEPRAKRGNKFGAQRTPCAAGHTHASKAEAARCGDLTLLLRAGRIRDLVQQPRFYFVLDGRRVVDDRGQAIRYTGDFAYDERRPDGGWVPVIEEIKGRYTDKTWRLRRAFFRFFHPEVTLRELSR